MGLRVTAMQGELSNIEVVGHDEGIVLENSPNLSLRHARSIGPKALQQSVAQHPWRSVFVSAALGAAMGVALDRLVTVVWF